MSDTTDTPRERKPLGLKRSIDAGEVKQTFSHGRTNKVVVEVKRSRVLRKPGDAPAPAPAPAPVAAPPPPPPPPPPRKSAPAGETPRRTACGSPRKPAVARRRRSSRRSRARSAAPRKTVASRAKPSRRAPPRPR